MNYNTRLTFLMSNSCQRLIAAYTVTHKCLLVTIREKYGPTLLNYSLERKPKTIKEIICDLGEKLYEAA
jgi:hypothetical protein